MKKYRICKEKKLDNTIQYRIEIRYKILWFYTKWKTYYYYKYTASALCPVVMRYPAVFRSIKELKKFINDYLHDIIISKTYMPLETVGNLNDEVNVKIDNLL